MDLRARSPRGRVPLSGRAVWRFACAAGVVAAALVPLAGFSDSSTSGPRIDRGPPPEPEGPLLVYEQGPGDARDLFVVPAGGGAPRRLTAHPASEGLPRWSADGRSVVFTSNRDGHWQLWRVSATGGDPLPVRANDHREWQADESPDGRTLAFLSNAGGPEWLWLLDLAGGDARPLVRHGRRTIMGNPHWSRDGKRIVFSSNRQQGHRIYVVEVATGKEKRISGSGGCEPRFHPDGTKVVYVGRRPQRDESRILEHDLATGEEKVLVAWPALNYDPVYSPDASEIAFASTITGSWEIYRQRLSDEKAWRVTFAGQDARYPDYRQISASRPAAAR